MDSRLKCQRIVVFLIFLTVCQSRELDIFYFSSYLNVTAFETLLSLSLSQCVTACKTRTRCTSVNYAKTGKTCELLYYSYNGCTTPGLHDGSFSTAVINKRFVHGCKTEWNMVILLCFFLFFSYMSRLFDMSAVANFFQDFIQSTPVISTSVISNNRLSRRENLILVLT